MPGERLNPMLGIDAKAPLSVNLKVMAVASASSAPSSRKLLRVQESTTLERLAGVLEQFRQRRHNDHWIPERLRFRSPRQAFQGLLAVAAVLRQPSRELCGTAVRRLGLTGHSPLIRPPTGGRDEILGWEKPNSAVARTDSANPVRRPADVNRRPARPCGEGKATSTQAA